MRHLRLILARIRDWWTRRLRKRSADVLPALSSGAPIYRDVTVHGVRVYSLCGGCGARLERSATLCEECARGPHTSTF